MRYVMPFESRRQHNRRKIPAFQASPLQILSTTKFHLWCLKLEMADNALILLPI
jgi:hypothetical protein